jgi:hypothetical protein
MAWWRHPPRGQEGGGSPRRVSGERESSLADPQGGPAATDIQPIYIHVRTYRQCIHEIIKMMPNWLTLWHVLYINSLECTIQCGWGNKQFLFYFYFTTGIFVRLYIGSAEDIYVCCSYCSWYKNIEGSVPIASKDNVITSSCKNFRLQVVEKKTHHHCSDHRYYQSEKSWLRSQFSSEKTMPVLSL